MRTLHLHLQTHHSIHMGFVDIKEAVQDTWRGSMDLTPCAFLRFKVSGAIVLHSQPFLNITVWASQPNEELCLFF